MFIYILCVYILCVYILCVYILCVYISYVDMISPFLSKVLGATLSGRPLATR